MKNARLIQSSAIGLSVGVFIVIAGRQVIDNVGVATYSTSVYGSISGSMLLFAGYTFIGLSILGFIVALLKD